MIGRGRERRARGDEVLEAVDSLLDALRETSKRSQAAARHAQRIRRLRSHGRSYTDILGHGPTTSTPRVRQRDLEAAVEASQRLERAEVRALRSEGLASDRIADLCGMTPAQVDRLAGGRE